MVVAVYSQMDGCSTNGGSSTNSHLLSLENARRAFREYVRSTEPALCEPYISRLKAISLLLLVAYSHGQSAEPPNKISLSGKERFENPTIREDIFNSLFDGVSVQDLGET